MKRTLLIIALIGFLLLLNPFVSLAQTTWAKRITITLYNNNADTTVYFSFPAVAGFAEISPSTTSQNPPDQVWSNGAHALVLKQTSGGLMDSLQIKIKPLDYDGTVVDNDSLVLGSLTDGSTGNLIKILNKPHVFTVTGSFDPLFGIAATFTCADQDTIVQTHTIAVEHTSNGSYYVRP